MQGIFSLETNSQKIHYLQFLNSTYTRTKDPFPFPETVTS